MEQPGFLRRDPLKEAVVEVATKRLFDLRNPEYDNPHWLSALKLVLNSVSNARLSEIAKTGVTSAVASLLNLLIESVRYPPVGEKAATEDENFTTRRSAVCDDFNRDLNLWRVSLGCESAASPDKGGKDSVNKKAADKAFQMWEAMFGQRGTPETERKIEQTTSILMHKIEQAEAAAKAKKRPTLAEARQRKRRKKGK